jgi:eukaryotic-like serine/threonine-protein kinase
MKQLNTPADRPMRGIVLRNCAKGLENRRTTHHTVAEFSPIIRATLAMPLAPGTRLGAYEILAFLAEGGMGKVYRARDTRLKREVAIKVLPESFATDPERLARFQREAEVLASLNHPHIAAIYGLEQTDGVQALVMELVEGPTLADRVAQGAIPVDEALPIAKQIAEALEAAHEQGIIHRDLKPANIKVRDDGTVKVLDFGLAKLAEPSAAAGTTSSPLSLSPTITSPALMTGVGVLLGTAAYMSPEQARGKAVDRRADIWAFGAVLYEMLTGKRAFDGEDVTDTLAAVVRSEPKWDLLPDAVSPSVRVYLRRCLHKDSKQRVGDIRDVRLALEGAFESSAVIPTAGVTVASVHPTWRRYLAPFLASLVTALVVSLAAWILWPAAEARLVSRFDIALPEGVQFRNTGRSVMALSPDGRRLVYNTSAGLYIRAMGELSSRPIPGTEEALTTPTFSPDGQSVAYYQNNQLKRIAISGGAPVIICAASNPFGMSWGRDNTILFGQPEGIMRVSADGGMPELVIRAEHGEQMDGPQMLPDGASVLFSVTRATDNTRWDQANIVVQSLGSGQRTVVLKGGSDARYLPTGHLVYALQNDLFAIAFDANRRQVRGGPVSVIQGVMRPLTPNANTAAANYGISDQGTLVYATGVAGGLIQGTLVWVDRTGQEEVIPAPTRAYVYPRVSPDGTRVALDIRDQENDIWVWDLTRQTLTRLTFDPAPDSYPVWSPDSRRVIFASTRSGQTFNLYWQAADGTGAPERLTESRNTQLPSSITPNGTEIVFRQGQEESRNDSVQGGQWDLMGLLLDSKERPPSFVVGSKTGTPLVKTKFNELNGEISPDSRWLAYESNESGRYEVHVRPFPDVDSGHWQVSMSGGRMPVWARSGDELFFVSPDGTILGVRVERSSSWRSSTPTKVLQGAAYYLLATNATVQLGRTFDVSADGKRFLMIKTGSGAAAPQPQDLVVVQHWDQELKRLVPTK